MESLRSVKSLLKKIYRRGPRFNKHLRSLENTYLYTPEQMQAHQSALLRAQIQHCYQHIPYYQNLFKSLDLSPRDIQTPADLGLLPLMSKQSVNENYDQLIWRAGKNPLCRIAETSGTTGTPTRFIRDYNSINFEHAAFHRHWQRNGIAGKRTLTLRGERVVPMNQPEPPFWQYNPLDDELEMCSYHLSLTTAQTYVDKILAFQPDVLYSAPAIAQSLAECFLAVGKSYRFEAIVTSSENLTPSIATFVESVFDAPVYDWYGQAERVAAAATCSAGRTHILEDYSFVELIDTPYGQEVVGTQFYNAVMPILRFRTGDYVALDHSPNPCECGASFRTIRQIQGRNGVYLLTPEGYRIFNTTHIPYGVDNLLETQFYQESPGSVEVRIRTNGNFSEDNEIALLERTRQYTSPYMDVRILQVESIPRGPNNKFVSIINRAAEAMN